VDDLKTNFSEKDEPLSLEEMKIATQKRVSLISKEFRDGFEFLFNYPKSVTFFGSTRFLEDNFYYQKAKKIAGRLVTEGGFSIITGGGPGIMQAAHHGANEVNGKAIGFTINLPKEQTTNKYVNEEVKFHYFFSRKVMLSFAAEAYLFFPGGFGTMDEFFEILTLVQTKKIHKVPIILVGSEFWNPIVEIMKIEFLEKYQTISEVDLELFFILDDEDKIVDKVLKAPIKNGLRYGHSTPIEKTLKTEPVKLKDKICKPCEEGGEPLSKEKCESYIDQAESWDLYKNKSISKYFVFKDFNEAIDFIEDLADLAEEQGHHPDFSLHDFNRVDVSLTTYAVGGLSENDFIMATKINDLEEKILTQRYKPILNKIKKPTP